MFRCVLPARIGHGHPIGEIDIDTPDFEIYAGAMTAIPSLAIHVGADLATEGGVQRWPRSVAAADTVRRTAQICRSAGVAEQRTLGGAAATKAAVLAALRDAAAGLTRDGLLVLTFSGRTVRGDGPIETTRWCLFDAGLAMSELAAHLARLPGTSRLVIITDTCHATAIARCLLGPQLAVVIASCREDQTMLERARSEFVVRLERLLCGEDCRCSLADVRATLEADTPDCERPAVWTNVADWWPARARAIFSNAA